MGLELPEGEKDDVLKIRRLEDRSDECRLCQGIVNFVCFILYQVVHNSQKGNCKDLLVTCPWRSNKGFEQSTQAKRLAVVDQKTGVLRVFGCPGIKL